MSIFSKIFKERGKSLKRYEKQVLKINELETELKKLSIEDIKTRSLDFKKRIREKKESPDDIYTSKIPVKKLVDAINFLLKSNFIGTINVGGFRKSFYELYKEFVPSLKPCKLKDIKDNLPIELPKDSSMDVSLWNKIGNNKIYEIN